MAYTCTWCTFLLWIVTFKTMSYNLQGITINVWYNFSRGREYYYKTKIKEIFWSRCHVKWRGKTKDVTLLVWKLVSLCFNCSLIPPIWLKGSHFTNPNKIWKRSMCPSELLMYQSVANIYKDYSSIMNKRMAKYCEINITFWQMSKMALDKRDLVLTIHFPSQA